MKLFAVLASEAVPEGFADVRQLAYLEAVAKFPAWAVDEAVRMWIAGEHRAEGENRDFVPKPAALVRLVKIAIAPSERRAADLGRLHAAAKDRAENPEPAINREQIAQSITELRDELKGEIERADSERATRVRGHVEKANQTMFERECIAAGMDPKSQVSPALLRLLGVPTTAEIKGDMQTPVTLDQEAIATAPDNLESRVGTFEKLQRTA